MKWMKWFVVLAVGLAMGLGAIGCGGDDDDGSGDPLVGTWSATAFNGQPMPDTVSVTIIFRDDGTCQETTVLGGEVETAHATWSAANGTLTIVSEDGTDSSPYSVSGNTLTLTSDGDVITLARQ